MRKSSSEFFRAFLLAAAAWLGACGGGSTGYGGFSALPVEANQGAETPVADLKETPTGEAPAGNNVAPQPNVGPAANEVIAAGVETGLVLVNLSENNLLDAGASNLALGVPLPVVVGTAPTRSFLSYYNAKLYAAGGCLSRQNVEGGYIVLRNCSDSNVYKWAQFVNTSYTHSSDFTSTYYFGQSSYMDSNSRYLFGATSLDNIRGNSAYFRMQHPINSAGVALGVRVHLAAAPSTCLTDSAAEKPVVAPCDANNRGQEWTFSLLKGSSFSGVPGPAQSGLGRCLGMDASSSAVLFDCNATNPAYISWFIAAGGHLFVVREGRRYLAYDPNSATVHFLSGLDESLTPYWGLGPPPP